jgi:hypothetical protein
MNPARALAVVLGLVVLGASASVAFGPLFPPSFAEEDDEEGADPGDEDGEGLEPEEGEEDGPPLPPAEMEAARKAFEDAVATQERRQYGAARKAFRRFLEAFPRAPRAMRLEADERSAENAFLGLEQIRSGGPSSNRIDVELMGDGYLLEQQQKFRDHAEAQIGDFYKDPLFAEYEPYFNVWRFDLASKEEGVDEVARPEPPPRPGKRARRRRPLKEFSTALNCQAAGPQNQVWADPAMVFRWRKYLPVSDGLTIAFAKKGQLGMGGMGIATTGRRVAVVHEFGHAFVGLLDEYAVNPEAPRGGQVLAANAVPGKGPKEPPDLRDVPWRHWIEAKNKDVGLFLGGATYQLGVYRPASDCAMNSGGGSPYCWVCREEGVLRIYEYVSPIDAATPEGDVVVLSDSATREFSVTPMRPETHALAVQWFLDRVPDVTAPAEGDDEVDEFPVASGPPPPRRGPWRRTDAGRYPPGPPPGRRLDPVERKTGGVLRSTLTVGPLTKGVWRLTAVVTDDARVPGWKFPWVLKDERRALEERRTWTLEVAIPPKPGPLRPPRRDD